MSIDFESLLDQCLNRIESEEDVRRCLEEHPEEAKELAPLLRVALQVRTLRAVEPRPLAAVSAGRKRFLEQAALLRQKQERSPFNRLVTKWRDLGQFPTTMRRGLATSAVVISFLLFFLVTGAWAVSARSLPGDPFYSVKLVREQVQLWLTLDQVAKVELQREFETRRLEETKTLLKERRQASVTFKGTASRLSDTVWVISGVTVTIPSNLAVSHDVDSGAQVEVQGWTLPDGSFVAQKLQVQPALPILTPQPTLLTPTPQATLPVILPTATNTTVSVSTATPKPTDTLRPPPTGTFTPWPTKPPEPTDTPTPTWSPTSTSTLEPISTRTLSPTPTQTRKPTATPTPPRVIKLQFAGAIKRIGPDSWEIGDQVVLVNQSTVIDKRGGAAEVGAWARVTGVRREDGALVALEIVIERPAERTPEVSEFQGIIESFGEAEWVVSGTSIRIAPSTVIEGTPVVGWLAWVRAVRYQSGPLIATNIRVIQPEIVVQFEGVIGSLGARQWVVDGQVVLITERTVIEGTPAVGLTAEIEAVQRPDGSLVARWIRVHPPAVPSPTVVGTTEAKPPSSVEGTPQSPTPSPTATPTVPTQPTKAKGTLAPTLPLPTLVPKMTPRATSPSLISYISGG